MVVSKNKVAWKRARFTKGKDGDKKFAKQILLLRVIVTILSVFLHVLSIAWMHETISAS